MEQPTVKEHRHDPHSMIIAACLLVMGVLVGQGIFLINPGARAMWANPFSQDDGAIRPVAGDSEETANLINWVMGDCTANGGVWVSYNQSDNSAGGDCGYPNGRSGISQDWTDCIERWTPVYDSEGNIEYWKKELDCPE